MTAWLYPNLGAEEGGVSKALRPGHPLRGIAAAWSLLFADSARLCAREAAADEAQAAADEAWGLAVDLLRVQLRLQLAAGGDGERPRQRLERLTARLDDQYSSWQLQDDGEPGPALRSPRDPGGHAAVEPLTDAPSP